MINDIITSFTADEFKTIIRDCVKTELSASVPPQPPTPLDEFITENDARDFLHVSKVTLKKWRDENKIPFYRIGTRIRYKKSEIISSLNRVGRIHK